MKKILNILVLLLIFSYCRKQKRIHRDNGFAIDHLVNDNRWRAGGGERCKSVFDLELARYPDPKEYGKWLQEMGLTISLDFNRCISKDCAGWKESFNMPLDDFVDYPKFRESRPDFTDPEVREWFWETIYSATAKKQFPVDGLWIDEFDSHRTMPYDTKLYTRNWASESNYYYSLIGKSLYEEGWKPNITNKRPYIWIRGMSAVAQKFGTLWSGDIYPNLKDYKRSIRSLQMAGISGFPYWGHDTGGFKNGKKKTS